MAAVSVRSSPDTPETKPPLSTEQGYVASQGSAPSFNGNGAGPASGLSSGSGPGMGVVNGFANAESSTRRSTSPVKVDPGKQAPVSSVPKHDRPIDMRAEEDAARRLNVGRVIGNSKYAGNEARGRKTDLFGPELKIRLERRAKNHQTAFDEDALAYLSKAAESRLRQVLSSSVSAQQHRTTTSYFHPPPMTSSTAASGSSTKPPRAMWDVSVSSDPNAVMDVLNRQSKEAEREFRTSRMNRLAKEHEMERIRERQAALSGDHNAGSSAVPSGSGSATGQGSSGQAPSPGGMNGNGNGNGDSGDSPGAHQPSSPDRAAPPPTVRQDSTPTFGGPKKLGKGLKKNAKDVSTDVQIKMSNATAMRSAGMGKKYSWMSSAPNISSPLSGNKKKGKKGKASEADADAEGEDEAAAGAGAGLGGGSALKKRKQDHGAGGDGSTTRTKRRRLPKAPTRRMVPVDGEGEAGKMVSDDKCLTIPDVVFALDRDKQGGQGMGTSDEIVRRVMARPGGPWGHVGGGLQRRAAEIKKG